MHAGRVGKPGDAMVSKKVAACDFFLFLFRVLFRLIFLNAEGGSLSGRGRDKRPVAFPKKRPAVLAGCVENGVTASS